MAITKISEKIEALLASGLSTKEIAGKVGCDISTIYRMRDGSIPDPRYSIGYQVDQLYQKHVSNFA